MHGKNELKLVKIAKNSQFITKSAKSKIQQKYFKNPKNNKIAK